ncbi:MAG: SUMF1/EgtB/PvdO family nonheme iron enzyme, partial [bacterium]
EWCQNWYGNYDGGSATDPTGPSSGLGRVLRGGSWDRNARNCRSARRINYDPADANVSVGFRVVVSR